jgi:hypothetical protein
MHRCTSIPASSIRPATVILSKAKDFRLIFLPRAKIAIRDVSSLRFKLRLGRRSAQQDRVESTAPSSQTSLIVVLLKLAK